MYRLVYYRNGKPEQTYIELNGERTLYSIALEIVLNAVSHTDTSFGVYDSNDNLIFSDEDVNED